MPPPMGSQERPEKAREARPEKCAIRLRKRNSCGFSYQPTIKAISSRSMFSFDELGRATMAPVESLDNNHSESVARFAWPIPVTPEVVVEARGVEPLSSKLSTQASTCLSGLKF